MNAQHVRSPQAEARAQSKREHILDAAQKCFVEHGFQGATMAVIAEMADMSAGLLYRYFESKNAIMLAIIARELDAKRARIDALCADADFLGGVLAMFRSWQTGSDAVMNPLLFLEMSAEASRSPDISQAVRASDALAFGQFQRWLQRDRGEGGLGLSASEAHTRGLLVQCIVEGLVVRAARDPELDLGTVRSALEPLFTQLGLLAPARSAAG